jgi:hypothetical protein
MLLRIIFKKKYKSISSGKIKINKLIANNLLDADDRCQLRIASMHDIFSSLDQSASNSLSNLFELEIYKLLRRFGVTFETQNDLICSQTDEEHKITPDFHITSNFFINGKKINWIDAKNFYGPNNQLLKKSISDQTKKYIDKWGNGCLIFSFGCNQNLVFDGILILSFDSFKTATLI